MEDHLPQHREVNMVTIHMQDHQVPPQVVVMEDHLPQHREVNMVTTHMQDHQLPPQVVVMEDHLPQHREVNMVTIHMQDHQLQDLLIADQVFLKEDHILVQYLEDQHYLHAVPHMVDQQDHLDAQTMVHQEDLYINRSFFCDCYELEVLI